jgi:hypothetical protein
MKERYDEGACNSRSETEQWSDRGQQILHLLCQSV